MARGTPEGRPPGEPATNASGSTGEKGSDKKGSDSKTTRRVGSFVTGSQKGAAKSESNKEKPSQKPTPEVAASNITNFFIERERSDNNERRPDAEPKKRKEGPEEPRLDAQPESRPEAVQSAPSYGPPEQMVPGLNMPKIEGPSLHKSEKLKPGESGEEEDDDDDTDKDEKTDRRGRKESSEYSEKEAKDFTPGSGEREDKRAWLEGVIFARDEKKETPEEASEPNEAEPAMPNAVTAEQAQEDDATVASEQEAQSPATVEQVSDEVPEGEPESAMHPELVPEVPITGIVNSAELASSAQSESVSPESQYTDMASPGVPVPEAAPMPSPAGGEVPPIEPPEGPRFATEGDPEPSEEPLAPISELADDIPETIPAAYVSIPSPEAGTWDPAGAYRLYEQHNALEQQGQQPVTRRELNDAVYYAEQSGQGRGLVIGALMGGLYEHFKHRRREKKAERRYKEQGKQLQKTREDQHFYYAEQTKLQSEGERRLTAAEQRSAAAERRFNEYKAQEGKTAERLKPTAMRQTTAAELQQRAAAEATEQLVVPPEHVLQTSAWHSIEIDKRTGRPVEKPTFNYGREYYQERASEGSSVPQRDVAAGEVALAATARAIGGGTSAVPQDTASSGPAGTPYVPSATTQGPPATKQRINTQAIRGQLAKSTSTGPIWPYLIALVVILFCLVVLLH